jgi:hypothetical protein
MVFIANDPGPWQYYVNRPDNKGLHIMEVRNKYLTEQLIFEEQYNRYIQQMNWLNNQGGGPSPFDPANTPEVEFTTQSGDIMVTQQGDNLIFT